MKPTSPIKGDQSRLNEARRIWWVNEGDVNGAISGWWISCIRINDCRSIYFATGCDVLGYGKLCRACILDEGGVTSATAQRFQAERTRASEGIENASVVEPNAAPSIFEDVK